MKKQYHLFIIFTLFSFSCLAQKPLEIGAEYMRLFGKGYNHTKVAARGETFSNKNSSFSAGITYQLASSKSYSVSRGFGLYFGYRYSFISTEIGNNPFAGARILVSFENFEGKSAKNNLLFTPWVEAGYHFLFANRYFASPSIGYGYTIEFSNNYNSMDEDVGRRIIPSISAGYRFFPN
jgi:hypothetical protein